MAKEESHAPDSANGTVPTSTSTSSSGRVVRGASLLIGLQVISRAITFVANQLLLRYLTAQLLGISTQLEVYYLSILFFARESLRVAIQRQGSEEQTSHGAPNRSRHMQAAVNLSYLSILVGVIVSLLLGWMYLASVNADVMAAPFLVPSLYIYAIAAVVELLSEPAFVVMQLRLQFGARATAESIATFLRCTVTLVSAVWASRRGLELGVLPFALGQVSYGCGQLFIYAWYGRSLAYKEGFSLLPKQLAAGEFVLAYFYRPTLNLASSMAAQSIVKHILTQGDTLLVSILSTPTAQGVYALANNYGGLAARLVFQPIEESSRNYFSRLLSPSPTAGPSKTASLRASKDMQTLLKLYFLLSIVIISLGPAAATPLLALVTGPRWAASGAGAALAAYMWYIPLLAVNGVTEAFVASVATEAEVYRQSVWMGLFSLVFGAAGFVCLRVLDLGAVGLVVSNCINMASRITWCIVFIRSYFDKLGVAFEASDLRPSPMGFLAAVVARQAVVHTVTPRPGAAPRDQLIDLVKIAGIAIPLVLVLAVTERKFLQRCYNSVRGKDKPA